MEKTKGNGNEVERLESLDKPKYRQLTMSFDKPVEEVRYNVLLEPEDLRREVEFANVQRVFEESKAFQFSAPNKIRQPRDVAYIFKQLETAAVENAFAVLVKDGKPTVIHLGMGSTRQCIVPFDSVIVADRKINADKIYLVHNHPSGNVYASREDISLLKRWQQVFGDKMQPGIIINSRSGIFGEFSLDGKAVKSALTEDSGQTQYPVKLYSFSKLVFSKDYKEAGTIRCSSDVAAFLAGQRLGTRPKLSYLVLSNSGSIQANIHTAYGSVHQENLKELARQIANDANVFGGVQVITYGSLPLQQMQIKKLQEELHQQEILLQDHINVQMDVNSLMEDAASMPYRYQSANEDGWISSLREPEISYGKERKEDDPVQGLKDYTREEIKDLVRNHIETVMEETGLDAQVIGVEIHGSRGRGDARPDSDLDVVVEYEGDMKEDAMFNLLNEDALRIDGVRVDVNPIRKQETGTLQEYQEYMERSRNYDREKLLQNQVVQLGFAKRVDEFEWIRDLAGKDRGLVMPGLMDKEVPLVYVVPHDFHGERPLTQAEIWAKHNLVGEYDAKDNTGKFFSYSISGKAIEKYLSNSANIKSDSIGVHLSVLKQLPDVIANSTEVEIHPDYRKGIEGKRLVSNGYNSDLLIHRFYGAIDVLGKTYRVKTTIQEIARPHKINRPHSYEVTKIEMLDLRPSISLAPTHGTTPCVRLAKLLQGIEKSYDPGKKVLEESQKVYQGFRPKQGRTRIQLKNRKRGRGL